MVRYRENREPATTFLGHVALSITGGWWSGIDESIISCAETEIMKKIANIKNIYWGNIIMLNL